MIGGALTLWGEVGTETEFLVENCLFEGNQAGNEAGAIWVFNGSNDFTASISRCKFIENQSPTGAAIGSNNNGLITPSDPTLAKLEMDNCLLSGNIGDNAISILDFPDFQILNSTIAGNTGGAIEVSNHSGLTLQNTILFNNKNHIELEILSGITSITSNGGNLIRDISFSPFALPYDLESVDPLFAGSDDYHLSDDSPAIDKGIDTEDFPEFDLDGNDRLNGCVDIGAYESETIVSEDCVTDTKEVLVGGVLLLSPNPAVDFLNIQLPENIIQVIEISIFDSQGRRVLIQSIFNGRSIDVEGFASGMYLVKVVEGGRMYTGRFVKQ